MCTLCMPSTELAGLPRNTAGMNKDEVEGGYELMSFFYGATHCDGQHRSK